MNKTEFLKQAKEKYKAQLTNKFVSEMNFIFSDKLILRVWFEHEGKLKGDICHKFCIVKTLPTQKNQKVENELGHFISNDSKDYPAIIGALKAELKTNPAGMIDGLEFNENSDTVDPIEKLEFTYTVKEFCELIGLK